MDSVRLEYLDGLATITLDRPERHNAFDDALIDELTQVLDEVGTHEDVSVVILTGAGRSFSAGADLGWMRRMADASEADNVRDAHALARLMRRLYELPKATIARVNGAAYGGGVGLVACCDIALADSQAKFGLTETRLGLVPAVISPYVMAAIGIRQARRYFLTAEIFDAHAAARIGLVHEVVATESLDAAVATQVELLRRAGPEAVVAAKRLAMRVAGLDADYLDRQDQENSALIARLRASDEGREGLAAFLSKRTPAWVATG